MRACFQNSAGTLGTNADGELSDGIVAIVASHTVDASPAFHDQKKYAPTTSAATRPRFKTFAPALFPPATSVWTSQNAP
jgi:hypothetical protein